MIVIGTHFLKGWSRTQQSITLSSAEADLVAMCKLSAELLGVLSMLKDLDEVRTGTVLADSTAALANENRKGSGKLRQINIGLLWIQEKEHRTCLREGSWDREPIGHDDKEHRRDKDKQVLGDAGTRVQGRKR
mgnify:CR=1 FL=1